MNNPPTARTPYCTKIRYGITGVPILTADEMDGSFAPGVGVAPKLIELAYSPARDGKPARVDASVTGDWTRFGEPDGFGGQVATHFKNGPDGWPAWLAEEARLHDPDAVPAGLPAVPPTTTDERRDRYAAAMAKRDGDTWPTEYEGDEADYRRRADAVIAVADAEQADLRTRIAELESSCRDMDRLRRDWVEMRARTEELDDRVQAMVANASATPVLPAGSEDTTTTRADALREAADRFDRYAEQLLEGVGELAVFVAKARRDQALVWREAARELRRLAAEAQPARSSCPDPIECGHEAALGQAQEEVRRLGLMVDEYGAGASALTDKLKRVRDLHHPASDWSWKPLGCQHDGEHGAPCRGCRGECWPCPTIRALDAASAGVQTDEETSR